MKIGKRKLRLSSGKIVTFKSSRARANWEHMAKAIKHGFKPRKKR